MADTFFTIGGIDDDRYPPQHPDVIKYFDRNSAEAMIKFLNNHNFFGKEVFVQETLVSVLTDKQECDVPPAGWRCSRGKGHDGPCAAWVEERAGK